MTRSPSPSAVRPSDAPGVARFAALAFFGALLAAHFYLATGNWRSGMMPGHEFRQVLTANNAYYIDQENNFSLRYSSPVLGKPWSIPIEYPLYEWAVVGLSRATGWPHVVAARTVTLACFYLTLPALFLLLGDVGVAPRRRWVMLGLVLCAPLYIFYSRAFLMDSMALLGAAWFLAAFVRTMRARRIGWLLPCVAGGVGSALVKSPVFLVWLIPATGHGAWCLWRDWRAQAGASTIGRTVAWGLACALPPLGALAWWVGYTDAIKVAHPVADFLATKALAAGSFGLFDLGQRFSAENWRLFAERWGEILMPAWALVLIVLVGAVAFPRERARILGAFALFLSAQLLFPAAYSIHDYYFYASAVFALAAIGFVLSGWLDTRCPAVLRLAVMLVPFAVMLSTYLNGYRSHHMVQSNGGSGLTDALRDNLPPDQVIIVVGNDWGPVIPYHARRRALMIRTGKENDWDYVDRAFESIADESVSALVLIGQQRENKELLERAARRFLLERTPALAHQDTEVYLSRIYQHSILGTLTRPEIYDGLQILARPTEPAGPSSAPEEIMPPVAAKAFGMVSPAPTKFRFEFGYALLADEAGRPLLSAHPNCDLWVPPPPNAQRIEWEFGLLPASYATESMADGVDFIVMAEAPGGVRREIARWYINPLKTPEERGLQRVSTPFRAEPGETLVFLTRAHGNAVYDWAYFAQIKVH